MKPRTVTATALTAAILAALTACSSHSSNSSSSATTPAQIGSSASTARTDDSGAALEQSVRDYASDLFSGNANGYRMVSARCKQQMTESAWADMATQAHHDYGAQKATGVHIDELSGDLARVSYGAGNIPQFNRKAQPWVRESGTWRWDACPATSPAP